VVWYGDEGKKEVWGVIVTKGRKAACKLIGTQGDVKRRGKISAWDRGTKGILRGFFFRGRKIMELRLYYHTMMGWFVADFWNEKTQLISNGATGKLSDCSSVTKKH